MSEEVKKRGKTPEFMKMMREKAAAKRAETKKIKEAQKLKDKQLHDNKLKEAEALLNPTQQKEEVFEEETPKEKVRSTPSPKEYTKDYKQEYYRQKLELLHEKKQPKHNNIEQPLPHKLLKQEFVNDINKTVMKELWKRHFRDEVTPYD